MKKRIISALILALVMVSVLAFASCGKEEESAKIDCPYENCDGALLDSSLEINLLYCDKNPTHIYKKCVNNECQMIMASTDKYCSKCGTQYIKSEETDECNVCKDTELTTTYCSNCGRQIEKKMKFDLDFDALAESGMILCKGMLGIFIVTGVIIATILILNTVVEKIKQSREE